MRVYPSNRCIFTSYVVFFVAVGSAMAQGKGDTCQAVGWDMSRELAAFSRPTVRVTAGAARMDMPALKLDQVYILELRPQSDVQFVHAPDKAPRASEPTAGLTSFIATKSGKYRVTVDSPLWIDVITPTGLVPPSSFNGWHECSVFRKSVEFSLQAGQVVLVRMALTLTAAA